MFASFPFFPFFPQKLHSFTKETKRGHEHLACRIIIAGDNLSFVKRCLKRFTKHELLDIAREVSIARNLANPDRLCHRSSMALYCWYCEHLSVMLEDHGELFQLPRATEPPRADFDTPSVVAGDETPFDEIDDVPFSDSPFEMSDFDDVKL
jgi:hypothetical protein